MILEIVILKLGVPAWLCGIEGLRYKLRPVLDRGGEIAGMNNVKGLAEGPRLLAVVDFEFDVGGNPACQVRRYWRLEWDEWTDQPGCVGLRSVPTISTSGCSSPTSLVNPTVRSQEMTEDGTHQARWPIFQSQFRRPTPCWDCSTGIGEVSGRGGCGISDGSGRGGRVRPTKELRLRSCVSASSKLVLHRSA